MRSLDNPPTFSVYDDIVLDKVYRAAYVKLRGGGPVRIGLFKDLMQDDSILSDNGRVTDIGPEDMYTFGFCGGKQRIAISSPEAKPTLVINHSLVIV